MALWKRRPRASLTPLFGELDPAEHDAIVETMAAIDAELLEFRANLAARSGLPYGCIPLTVRVGHYWVSMQCEVAGGTSGADVVTFVLGLEAERKAPGTWWVSGGVGVDPPLDEPSAGMWDPVDLGRRHFTTPTGAMAGLHQALGELRRIAERRPPTPAAWRAAMLDQDDG